jgi:fatty-acid peroxygenase
MSPPSRGNTTTMTTQRPAAPTVATGARDALTQPAGLLRHGYRHWELMRQRAGSEIVQTRLLNERITVIRGAEAAQFFYETPHAERSSALPTSLVGALFGMGAVHMLDGDAHLHRKAMFNRMLDEYASAEVCAGIAKRWDDRAPRWLGYIDVFEHIAEILFEAGTEWAGLPDSGPHTRARTRDMLDLVDGFGAPSARQVRARAARRRAQVWVESFVKASRRDAVESRTPAGSVIAYRDERGEPLDVHTAAVEIINLIRPLVAVSWLVSGLAMVCQTGRRQQILAASVSPMDVAQEVRRTYPFVPFLATRATQDLVHGGAAIPSGSLLVLDAWGTNHDPRIWQAPDTFDPRRFRTTPVTPYNLVPQGGGDRHTGHRCPGEDMTLAVLATLEPRLTALPYSFIGDAPGLRRMPPKPRSRLRVG